MVILKILLCILILVAVPMCMGLLVLAPLERGEHTLGLALPAGYMVMMISFELVAVPVYLTTQYSNFKYVVAIYTPIMIILAGLGLFFTVKREKKAGVTDKEGLKIRFLHAVESYRTQSREAVIVWIIAIVILIVMLVLAETRVIFDGDDAYYVVQSLITQQNGTMYVIQPYTGRAASMDVRHALAMFTMWIAYVGKATGFHTTVVCHTILPLILIPLSLLTYLEIGIRLLREKKDMIPYYMVFIELIILFGRVSIYTSETFLLSRTWQGKAVAANILIPLTLLGILIMVGSREKSRWIMLVLVDAAAGIFSSLAIVLVSILILASGFAACINERKIRTMIMSGICCVPGAVYMAIYLYFTYWGWR